MIPTEIVELARASRVAQGLPPTNDDPKFLNLLAALFGKPVDEKRRAA